MSILLTKLGFHSTFPRSIVFAPIHIVGIGLIPFIELIIKEKIRFYTEILVAIQKLIK